MIQVEAIKCLSACLHSGKPILHLIWAAPFSSLLSATAACENMSKKIWLFF